MCTVAGCKNKAKKGLGAKQATFCRVHRAQGGHCLALPLACVLRGGMHASELLPGIYEPEQKAQQHSWFERQQLLYHGHLFRQVASTFLCLVWQARRA